MRIIISGAAAAEQVGALLTVLRYRGETAEELAGFVRAARATMRPPGTELAVLDWPSYADTHKQMPYFLLAARLLAESGTSVLMHGITGTGSVTTPACLASIGIAPSPSQAAAAKAIAARGFAYLQLDLVCSPLARLLALRDVLGVRTVVNSLARALNPWAAPYQMLGVFHPDFLRKQIAAAELLNQSNIAVLRGAGGEAQRNPEKPCTVATIRDGVVGREDWPVLLEGIRHPWRTEPLEPAHLAALWSGTAKDPGPVAAVVGTAAIALRLVGRATDAVAAQAEATRLWHTRRRTR